MDMNETSRSTGKKRYRFSPKIKEEKKNRWLDIWKRIRPYATYQGTLFLTILGVYILIRPPAAEDLTGYRLNQPSPRVISAPFEFEFIDEAATKDLQIREEYLISPIYDAVPDNWTETLKKLEILDQTVHNTPPAEGQKSDEWAQAVLHQSGLVLKNRFYETSDNTPENHPKSTYDSLAFYKGYDAFWKSLSTHIQAAAGKGPDGIALIADDVTPLRRETHTKSSANSAPKIQVGATLRFAENREIIVPSVQEIKTVEEFLQIFLQLFSTSFPDPVKDYAAKELAMDLIQAGFTGPTLIYNNTLTETKKTEARRRVQPILIHVNKDETIIGKNELITEKHLQKLKALQAQMSLSPLAEIGYFILAIFFVTILVAYFKAYQLEIAGDIRKISVIFLGIFMIFILSHVFVHFSRLDLGSNTLKQATFGIPMGALGVILTMLTGARPATFICTLASIYLGMILRTHSDAVILPYILVSLFTTCGAIYTVTHIRQRSDLYRAGGVVMILSSVLILALSLQQSKSLEHLILEASEIKWALIWGAVNGGLVPILSIALLPIFEDLFGITTDMKLLELSQKNKLLQRLEQDAPGSYQHSMRVATLAESAAEAIEANALLTRVGCYYHDIGKMVKPQYFIENQQTFADKAKHSKLSPNMSCLIIRNHVKHGLELAKEYKLPKVITDFIPEHHGTTLMGYFYYEALAQQETEGTVKEEDYRYPGPKPQSKETAIAMLADVLEAASRTLESVTERDVRQLVRKIINERFMDGQFDECTLTLKDLHTLFLSFSDSILHTLHQRIVYPTLAPKDKEEEEDTRNGNHAEEKLEPVGAFKEKKDLERITKTKD